MAEDFLEEIYEKAMIIERVREYVAYSYAGRERDARRIYNQAAGGIEKVIAYICEADAALADRLLKAAVDIHDVYEDTYHAVSIAESRLIPTLFECMQLYSGIDVEEGKYRLLSTNTGFLTIVDTEQCKTIHSTFDPLWEAYRIADSIYDPAVECYHILGVGLGYIPYQLWRRSEGAVKIVVYEEDQSILSYAKNYGILDWISADSLEKVYYKDVDELASFFLKRTGFTGNSITYISPWKKEIYRDVQNGKIAVMEMNDALSRSMRDRTVINIWKNEKHKQIRFEVLKQKLQFDEWIVVSAGPSLDDNLEYLKTSRGKRGIIAVNTVLRRLFNENITPDLVVAADQYVQMKEHINGIGEKTAEIPCIAERRVNWQYVEQYMGPICFVSVEEGDEDCWHISGSVAGLALEAAVRLGAKKVFLVGQDLAYPDGKTYAAGMPYVADAQSRGTMLVKAVDGNMVPTSEAFNWFRIGLEEQIEKYGKVEFYNLSQRGALIRGCREYSDRR